MATLGGIPITLRLRVEAGAGGALVDVGHADMSLVLPVTVEVGQDEDGRLATVHIDTSTFTAALTSATTAFEETLTGVLIGREAGAQGPAEDDDWTQRNAAAVRGEVPPGGRHEIYKPDHEHVPVQHRDGCEPWCNECGLTAHLTEPVSRLDKASKGRG